MFEPAQIAVEESAQVVHPIFQHGEPVDAGAEGKALPFVRIEPARLDHPAVDHAAAQPLHPAAARRLAVAADHPPAPPQRIADLPTPRRLRATATARPHAPTTPPP